MRAVRSAPPKLILRLVLAGLGVAWAISLAWAQVTATQLVGKWVLTSVYEENDGGEDLDRWGTAPQGQFIADAEGRFSLLLVGRNITRIAENNAERACYNLPACREFMDRRVIGYSGRLTASKGDEFILHVDDALDRGWSGLRIIASVTLKGDELHFITASDPSPTGSFYVHLAWRKSRSTN